MKTLEEKRVDNFIQMMNKNLRLQSDILENDSSVAIIIGKKLWRFVYYFDINELNLNIKGNGKTEMYSEDNSYIGEDGWKHSPIMTIKDILVVHLAAKSMTLDHLEKLLFMTL